MSVLTEPWLEIQNVIAIRPTMLNICIFVPISKQFENEIQFFGVGEFGYLFSFNHCSIINSLVISMFSAF